MGFEKVAKIMSKWAFLWRIFTSNARTFVALALPLEFCLSTPYWVEHGFDIHPDSDVCVNDRLDRILFCSIRFPNSSLLRKYLFLVLPFSCQRC